MAIYKKLNKVLEDNQHIILTKGEDDQNITNIDQTRVNYQD